MRSSSQADGEKPDSHQAKEKPVYITVYAAGVQGTRTKADQPGDAGGDRNVDPVYAQDLSVEIGDVLEFDIAYGPRLRPRAR